MSDDISFALAAKSDQLNAMDIMGFEPVITIRKVEVKKTTSQPVWVYYHGDNNKPWKPSKGMLRIMAAAWGVSTKEWVGKSAKIYCDPDVVYAGRKAGGVRILELSHIDEDMNFMLSINRGQRVPFPVKKLILDEKEYPEKDFNEHFDKMVEVMTKPNASGKVMSLQQVIAQCEKRGRLTNEQLKRLEAAAPVDADDDDELLDTRGVDQ